MPTIIEPEKRHKVKLTEIDGKPAMIFEEIPAVIFISHDGHGTFDQLFVEGVEDVTRRAITIKSEVAGLTTIEVEKYVTVIDKEVNE